MSHVPRLKAEGRESRKAHQGFARLFVCVPRTPDFHSVSVHKKNAQYDINELVVTLNSSNEEFVDKTALIIGDAIHNLRSALDILWYEIVNPTGLATSKTRFPIFDTRQELIDCFLSEALKKRQITDSVHDLVLDSVKPYKEGNYNIWALHQMDILDKHQLLLPTFPMIGIEGIRLQSDEHSVVEFPVIYTQESCRMHLSDAYGRNPQLDNRGRASVGQGFDLEIPNQGQPVIPTLHAITKEITRTIEAFDVLFT